MDLAGKDSLSSKALLWSRVLSDFNLLVSGSKPFLSSLASSFLGSEATTVFSLNVSGSSQDASNCLFFGFGKKNDRISCCLSFSN